MARAHAVCKNFKNINNFLTIVREHNVSKKVYIVIVVENKEAINGRRVKSVEKQSVPGPKPVWARPGQAKGQETKRHRHLSPRRQQQSETDREERGTRNERSVASFRA